MNFTKGILISSALVLGTIGGSLFAGELRLNGASTTVSAVIDPHKEAVEKATGIKLKIAAIGTGKGLVDLAEGRADLALTSEPLEIAVAAAKIAGKEIQIATLQLHKVAEQEIVFVVHPSNTVNKLTHAQIKDIHLGKIKNWKEVGGSDAPIMVFTDNKTGGTRAMVKKIVFNDEEYGPNCKALESVKKVNDNVADFKNGFGAVGMAFVDKNKVKIIETEKIVRPLGFISLGNPSADATKVIDAYKKEAVK